MSTKERPGRMLGRNYGAVSILELGQYPDPRVSVALKVARALRCKVEDLFSVGE